MGKKTGEYNGDLISTKDTFRDLKNLKHQN